jgi:dipeptidyl aminopeptidase/acylaminoacyl peptidase
MTRHLITAVCAAMLCTGTAVAAAPQQPLLHTFADVTISPNGSRVADIEHDDPVIDGTPVHSSLVIRKIPGNAAISVPLACGVVADCTPSSPAWSADGRRLAYVLKSPNAPTRAIWSVDANGGNPALLLNFPGTLYGLRYARDGSLTVLATAGAHKEAGATQVGADITGEIGASFDEQRIARVAGGKLTYASPADLYVYEYDINPRGGFVGTAAHGDGDNNWWIAKLYTFDAQGRANVIYAPPATQQLAHPRVSPKGDAVAFIGGIMSDFGSTGGDAYLIPLDGGKASTPADVTDNLNGSVTSLGWDCDNAHIVTTELSGPEYAVEATDPHEGPSVGHVLLWHGSMSLSAARDESASTACTTTQSATVMQSFTQAPEIYVGQPGEWRPLTHNNAAMHVAATATSISWKSDGYDVQGWLLTPAKPETPPGMKAVTSVLKRAMITVVHGGPSAAYTPRFIGRGTTRDLLARGYDVFLPNPRGSFGAGEKFTMANIKDFGYGDLRDVMSGIDAVEKQSPVDDNKLGIMGYSYGGYMTMWTVTQTHRFKAAVSGAGVSDWLSYYGENGIDQWMIPFFGASVYDDPAVYLKSSPMTYIKNVTTPTFEYVGDHDVECPMPQTQEFWHALQTFHVPTSFVVYPHEGHGLRNPHNRADANARTLAWFDKYLK